jgi:hypothetical protein
VESASIGHFHQGQGNITLSARRRRSHLSRLVASVLHGRAGNRWKAPESAVFDAIAGNKKTRP